MSSSAWSRRGLMGIQVSLKEQPFPSSTLSSPNISFPTSIEQTHHQLQTLKLLQHFIDTSKLTSCAVRSPQPVPTALAMITARAITTASSICRRSLLVPHQKLESMLIIVGT